MTRIALLSSLVLLLQCCSGSAFAQPPAPDVPTRLTPSRDELDGSELDGSELDGSEADGSEADGSEADGSEADGSDQDGGDQDDDRQADADLELISAIERVVARSIRRAEKSVVSIARRSTNEHDEQALRDTRADLIRVPRGIGAAAPLGPGDPDFVPNDFASGVVIGRNGLVLTNMHVLGAELTDEYWVTTARGHSFRMRIKAADPRSDLAVLEVVTPQPALDEFVPIRFGDGTKLRKGQFVVALGNPYAIARDGQVSASWGIIANLSRRAAPPSTSEGVPHTPATLHQFGTLIQTDARLNLGTSGGALVNKRGDMIGLTTSQAALAGFEQSAGYAIAVDDIFLRAVETLKEGREVEYGLLGVEPINFVDSKGRHAEALVTGIRPKLPAYRAGINNGDVVTHVDGRPIEGADGLRLLIGKRPAAAMVTLTLLRDGRLLQKRVTLGKFLVNKRQIVTQRQAAWRGMRVEYPTAVDLTGGLNLGDPAGRFDRGGFDGTYVTVTEVEPGSPAARAGLRPGAWLSQAADTPLETPDDFRRAVADKAGPVKLRVVTSTGEISTLTVAEGP